MKSHGVMVEDLLGRFGSAEKPNSLCGQGLSALHEAGLIMEDSSTDALAKAFVASQHKETLLAWFEILRQSSLFNQKFSSAIKFLIDNPVQAKVSQENTSRIVGSTRVTATMTELEKSDVIMKVILSNNLSEMNICLTYMQHLNLLNPDIRCRAIFEKVMRESSDIKKLRIVLPLFAVAGYFVKQDECARVFEELLENPRILSKIYNVAGLLFYADVTVDALIISIENNIAVLCQEGEQRTAYIKQLTEQYRHAPALIQMALSESYLENASQDKITAMAAFVGSNLLTFDRFPEWYHRQIHIKSGYTLAIIFQYSYKLPSKSKRDLVQYLFEHFAEINQVGNFLNFLSIVKLLSNNSLVVDIIQKFIEHAAYSQSVNQCLSLLCATGFFQKDSARDIICTIVENAKRASHLHQLLTSLHTVKCLSPNISAMHRVNIERLALSASDDLLYLAEHLVVKDNLIDYPRRCLRLLFLAGYAEYASSMAAAHKLLSAADIHNNDILCMTGKYAERYALALVLLKQAGLYHHQSLRGELLLSARYAEGVARCIIFLHKNGIPYKSLGEAEEKILNAGHAIGDVQLVLFHLAKMGIPMTMQCLNVLLSDPCSAQILYTMLAHLKSSHLLLGDQGKANVNALFQYYDFLLESDFFQGLKENATITQSEFDEMISRVKTIDSELRHRAIVLAQGMKANPRFADVMNQNLIPIVGFFAPVQHAYVQEVRLDAEYSKTLSRGK